MLDREHERILASSNGLKPTEGGEEEEGDVEFTLVEQGEKSHKYSHLPLR